MKTLDDLLEERKLKPFDLAAGARLHPKTIERARAGQMPNPVGVYAISIVLDVTEAQVREAIAASASND